VCHQAVAGCSGFVAMEFSDANLHRHSQVYAKWKELPLEDVQAWTLLTAETQSAVDPPR
jgi:hypothetical protein